MEQICDKLSHSASDYLRERVSDIRDISEQLLSITRLSFSKRPYLRWMRPRF